MRRASVRGRLAGGADDDRTRSADGMPQAQRQTVAAEGGADREGRVGVPRRAGAGDGLRASGAAAGPSSSAASLEGRSGSPRRCVRRRGRPTWRSRRLRSRRGPPAGAWCGGRTSVSRRGRVWRSAGAWGLVGCRDRPRPRRRSDGCRSAPGSPWATRRRLRRARRRDRGRVADQVGRQRRRLAGERAARGPRGREHLSWPSHLVEETFQITYRLPLAS